MEKPNSIPYGFDAMATASYVNKQNPDLSLVADVYRMASVLDALEFTPTTARQIICGLPIWRRGICVFLPN